MMHIGIFMHLTIITYKIPFLWQDYTLTGSFAMLCEFYGQLCQAWMTYIFNEAAICQ